MEDIDKEERVYWVNGVKLHKGMSFMSKVETICKRFKPKMIEHGQGYAVLQYEFTHEAARAGRHLKTYTAHYEKWSISVFNKYVSVIDRNWSPKDLTIKDLKKTEENVDDNSTYAG